MGTRMLRTFLLFPASYENRLLCEVLCRGSFGSSRNPPHSVISQENDCVGGGKNVSGSKQNLEQNKRFLRALPAGRIIHFYEQNLSRSIPRHCKLRTNCLQNLFWLGDFVLAEFFFYWGRNGRENGHPRPHSSCIDICERVWMGLTDN